MQMICGVDGCKAGWLVVSKDLDSGEISWRVCSTACEIVCADPTPQIIAIDIPIGLQERGPRDCDLGARRLLGRPRASSVFPTPIRPILDANSREDASQIWFEVEKKKISCQTWAIVPKIRDVDEMLRQGSGQRARFHEIHPEVCFYFLAGKRPMKHSKKTTPGREERRKLLEREFGPWLHAALAEQRKELACAEDDLLDAFVALWTAEGIASGLSQTIPLEPSADTFDLLMEIVYRPLEQ